MQLRTPAMIVLALTCGIAASMGLANMLGKAPPLPEDQTTRIYVALRDIQDGETLDERSVRLMKWPSAGLPPTAVERMEQLKNRLADGRIEAGQPIEAAQLQTLAERTASRRGGERGSTTSEPAIASDSGRGPWIVSTGEKLHVASLDELCRHAVELARRADGGAAASPVATENSASPSAESDRPAHDAPTETPAVEPTSPVASPALPATPAKTASASSAALAAPVVDATPWMSSIVTPEGAKVMRWRRGDEGLGDVEVASSESLVGRTLQLSGRTLDGRPFDGAAYRGRPVLVVVCLARDARCREELSLVRRAAEAYRHSRLEVVGVSLDEELDSLRAFVRHNGIDWPIVAGPAARDWAARQGVDAAAPALLVIDEEGRVVGQGGRADEVSAALAGVCGESSGVPAARQARRSASAPRP